MANEISVSTGELVALVDEHGIGDVLKPLVKEIYLFDSYIAGTTHVEDDSVFAEIKEGDKLSLKREDNKYDANAIMIFAESGKKLGYVPKKDNIVFSRLMDAGKLLIARIKEIKVRGKFNDIKIDIYLVDF